MVNLKIKQIYNKKDKKRSQIWETIFLDALNKNTEGIKYVPII